MIDTDRLIAADPQEGEGRVDHAIRPRRLADYIGQPRVREQLEIFIHAARARDESLDHTLVFGPPGLGKTTLAKLILRLEVLSLDSYSWIVIKAAGPHIS